MRWASQKKSDGAIVVSERGRSRLDVWVQTLVPRQNAFRLARQVSQDMWRAVQKQRGFSPVVKIEETDSGLIVTAGGQIDGVFPKAHLEAKIADVLEDPKNRARWLRWARLREDVNA